MIRWGMRAVLRGGVRSRVWRRSCCQWSACWQVRDSHLCGSVSGNCSNLSPLFLSCVPSPPSSSPQNLTMRAEQTSTRLKCGGRTESSFTDSPRRSYASLWDFKGEVWMTSANPPRRRPALFLCVLSLHEHSWSSLG